MNYTQSIGNCTELQCLIKFEELGYECSIPYGNGAKYDFIVDVNGDLKRIQCKSASQVKKKTGEMDDAIQIATISQTTNTQKTTRHTYDKNQIDYFATTYKGKVYIIPVEECSQSKTLRFSPPANNQSNYNKAEDYLIEKWFTPSLDLIETKEKYFNRFDSKKQIKKEQSKKEIKKYYCKECGKEITAYASTGMCPDCQHKSTRKVERPEREVLKNMIRIEPFTTIAKKYGVTDKAIVKWCIAENLPSRKTDIRQISDEDWKEI